MTIVRLPVGDGSPEGQNSAYLLPDRGLLVDPGPPGDDAWADLCGGITAAGFDLTDVDTVFVTHWHIDHAGLAVRLADAADAAIAMHAEDAPLVGDYARQRARRLDRDARRLREWGVPADGIEAVRAADTPSPLPDEYPVDAVADGDLIGGLEVLHTPGHTAGHAALTDRASGVLLVGDAVLSTYTPNAGGGDTRLQDPLADYLDTLDRIERLGWTSVHPAAVTLRPGHGAAVAFPDRLETIRKHHDDRARRVLDVIRSAGPATPWTVATTLFGDMADHHVKMGAGEAAAHLVRLDRTGAVDLVAEAPNRYTPATPRPTRE